jgi:hypothetical protein
MDVLQEISENADNPSIIQRRNYRVKVLLSKREKELAVVNAMKLGFRSVGAYARWCMTSQVPQDLQEIKQVVEKWTKYLNGSKN